MEMWTESVFGEQDIYLSPCHYPGRSLRTTSARNRAGTKSATEEYALFYRMGCRIGACERREQKINLSPFLFEENQSVPFSFPAHNSGGTRMETGTDYCFRICHIFTIPGDCYGLHLPRIELVRNQRRENMPCIIGGDGGRAACERRGQKINLSPFYNLFKNLSKKMRFIPEVLLNSCMSMLLMMLLLEDLCRQPPQN